MKIAERRKPKWKKYGAAVLALHLAGIGLLLLSLKESPALLGLGILAYTLGLRHAFDADHIAAIDNTVRKLLQQNKNPTGVGFYFSLGHSTVVCCMAVAVALAARWAGARLPQFRDIGGVIGASVSGFFLVLMGALNLAILLQIYQVFRKMRSGSYRNDQLERMLESRGLLARLLNPLFRLVGQSWHVYPIGLLFGLGFDTASEVALMALSAGTGGNELPVSGILALPLLFASGMSLMDTADGVFMTTAYRWAFRTPLRKAYYNMTVTGLSVVAALFIGSIELAQVLTSKLGMDGSFSQWVQALNLADVGYMTVALFAVSWAVSYGIWKLMKIEERWSPR
ncbi:HoxN/HupN/NixA family nickel/cobalt transporter [Cohnella zeiphila]|uniref:Nickel/cobalt efflux system n=1 Tax=Cohnella zeiphila TaxID=2761120 RepID=A0A7X0SH68_9BACL|nr:HoxN/HupN/NixA family nickel/cobalt transporter [Cohnella zeiphila]MBB6729872.1 HoxN/HupN/NixA family nickel/cobalt transporter [Cohnella zeiphila]